jgi:hypothetical protein
MPSQNDGHNLLLVSDLHIAAGLQAEAGESCHGLEAFLYDGAFARFLRYHEQMRRDAADRQEAFAQARTRGELVDEAAEQEAARLANPWRLILAGDVFDFWDVVRVPDDAGSLQAALDDQIGVLEPKSPAVLWLRKLKMRLSAVQADLKVPEWDYEVVRGKLDALDLDDGRQRRAVEELTWWTEVLVLKRGELSRRERRHGLGTTWQEVVWKLTLIYRGHREFFGALAWFIACGNEVILLKGNHDIELYWPQVHDGHLPHLLADAYRELRGGRSLSCALGDYPPELLVALPSEEDFRRFLPTCTSDKTNPADPQGPPTRKRFVFEDWYYCEPDLVYVEHGNQYEPADSSVCFLEPTMPSDPSRIELPWGAFMVRYFYNRIVAVHPFAVNVKPEQRIIHWMIHHDLFRLLGIVLAELIDIVRGLVRAVKQGFRGTWIWGDHSLSGLIPLFIYDLIQIRIWVDRRCQERRGGSAQAAPSGKCPGSQSDIEALSARTLLHLGALGTALCLLLGGAGLLFCPAWENDPKVALAVLAALLVSAAVATIGAARSVRLGREQGRHSLGELTLQLGAVGAVAASIISLSVGSVKQWSSAALISIVAAFLVAAAAGAWLIWKAEKAVVSEGGLFRRTWQARCLRSGASLFLELGVLVTLAGAYYQFWENDSTSAGAWLRAGLALFIAGWAAYLLHGLYVNQPRLESQPAGPTLKLRRAIRHTCTVLVVLLAGSLVVAPLAWLVNEAIGSLFAGGGPREIQAVATFANTLYGTLTDGRFGASLLVVLVMAMAAVFLAEPAAQWLIERWRIRQLRPRASRANREGSGREPLATRWALAYQRDEIQELAKAEQRRWLGGLLGMLTLFLPVVSLALLLVTLAGSLAALLSLLYPLQVAVEPLKALGVSVLFGLGYWLLRQISAARRRHDPRSSFGDLFYRMATGIASILATTKDWPGGPGLGQPRYFVFGHDHWADSKPLPRGRRASRRGRQQWYVNTGTWLRGYVEEQREQEVNENHSTFVQIIPGLGDDEAPRVLRWNDGANQPEPIVRRKEPESTSEMIWTRWEGGWVWALVWALLLALTWRLAPPEWMTELWPLVWTLGLGLASCFLVQATRWLLQDAGRGLLKKSAQPELAPDPVKVTDIHCHVGLVGDEHPEWGRMLDEYREKAVFKAMLIYGRLDADQVCDAALRASTEEAIAGSHVGHIVCLALDPVYDLEGTPRKDQSYLWVANEYILELQRTLGNKVLLGASVHPYDPAFKERVAHYVNKGAVLLKWLPSAQQIDLAHSKVREALAFLATARDGKPLPLLLHIGPEYAIPSKDPRTASYDYLTWTWWDELKNRLRDPDERLYPVQTGKIHANLQAGLDAGAVIIFAHCGLPYYAPRWFGRFLEHSELRTIRRYLESYPAGGRDGKGRCYADVSALVTPFRRSYYGAIRRLPPQSLLFGSDFPTPVFELSEGVGGALEDLEAALEGHVDRLLVPEDNLIDVNFRELQRIFPGHPMFRNFDELLRFIDLDEILR